MSDPGDEQARSTKALHGCIPEQGGVNQGRSAPMIASRRKRSATWRYFLLAISFAADAYAQQSSERKPNNDNASATIAAFQVSGANSNKITTLTVKNLGATATKETPATFGQVFMPGDVPKGVLLSGRLTSGKTLALQVDAKATHSDGSLRHAVVSMIAPGIEGKKSIAIDLVRSSVIAQTEHDTIEHAAPLRELTAEIVLVIEGRRYSASIQSVSVAKQSKRWLSGPLVNEWIFLESLKNAAGETHPQLTLRGSLRAYRSGAARLDIVLENGWAFALAPRDYRYDVSVKLGADVIYEKLSLVHYHLSRWRKVFWWGAAPNVMVSQDPRYLIKTRAVPSYDLRVRVARQTLERYAKKMGSADFEPMGRGLATTGMRTSGGRPEIGPLPDWGAAQILSQDSDAWAATVAMGDLSGSWPIHYRDQNTDLPVTIEDYPYMTLLGRSADAVNKKTGKSEWFPACDARCKTPFNPDSAHQPSFAYLPYLITGDYYYLEELLFWANWNLIAFAPSYREFEKGLLKSGQVRAQAWTLRTLAQAAAIAPDSHPLKRYFVDRVQANLAWYNERFSNNSDANKLGVLATASAIAYEDGLGIAPWQDDFFTWAVGYTWALGFPKARSLLNWKAKFPVARMVDAGFCWIFASEYTVIVRANKNSDQLFETMGQVYAATIANRANSKGIRLGDLACASREMADWRTTARADKKQSLGPVAMTEMVGYPQSAEGFPAIMQPALAVAVDNDVPGSQQAWRRFVSRAMPTDYRSEPQFAIVPLSAVAE